MVITEEQRAEKIAALVEERGGVEQALAGAREAHDADRVASLAQRQAEIVDQLRVFSGEAAPKAQRAEKRPATKSKSTRGGAKA